LKSTRAKALFSALAIFASVSIIGAGSASAATSQDRGLALASSVFASADPQAAYKQLSASDQALFTSVETPAKAPTAPVSIPKLGSTPNLATAAYTGCWGMAESYVQRSLAGNVLYSYGNAVIVCVSNGVVTSVEVSNVWQQTSTIGWRFTAADSSTLNMGWEGRGRSQFHFILGLGGWDVQYENPCSQIRVNANGYNYSVSTACSLV
jgi:hypothetical protein